MAARMPFFKALGPLGDVFNNWYLNQFSSKYEDVTSAASLEKVRGSAWKQLVQCRESGHVLFGHAFITTTGRPGPSYAD